MTNEELLAKIKAEIERRIKECEATYPKDKDGYWFPEQEEAHAIAEEYKQLLSFLSTLEEQTKEVHNPIFDECVANVDADTREEVRRNIEIENELVRFYLKDLCGSEKDEISEATLHNNFPIMWDDLRDIARHFAEWGAEHAKIDVTDFCKPIDPGIAQCIADHSWEMLGEDEKPVPNDLDFEQELYKHFGQVKDFTLGMRIGKYFYELGCRRTAEKYDEIEYNRQREEEKPINQDDLEKEIDKRLEEAADEYAYRGLPDEMKPYVKPVGDEIIKNFLAGAKWQAEQLLKSSPLPEDTVIYQKGVEEGKRLMMSEAVEIGTTEIYWEPDGDRAFPTFDPPVEDLLMPDIISQRFNEGDKVRIIILPKED